MRLRHRAISEIACLRFTRTDNPGQWVGALVLEVPIR